MKAVCSVDKCTSESYRSTIFSSPTEIATLLDVRLTSFTVDVDGSKIPLCCSHYNHLCSILRELPKCCELVEPNLREKQFIRHCSAPDVINAYISILYDEQAFLIELLSKSSKHKYLVSLLKKMVPELPAAGGFNYPAHMRRGKVIGHVVVVVVDTKIAKSRDVCT